MGALPNLSILKGTTRSLKPGLLHKLFENLANAATASEIALIFEKNGEKKQYTYSELNNVTNQTAKAILEICKRNQVMSNSDGDNIVAVSMQPTDSLVITLLSILKAGAAYLPLDAEFPPNRVEHILSESKPLMVVYDQDLGYFKNTLKVSYDKLLEQAKQHTEKALEDKEVLQHGNDNLAIILYTSGSTGVPKGVRIPHNVVLNRLNWQTKTFPYGCNERIGVFKTALTFVDSVSEIWGPLVNGLSLLVVPKSFTKDPEKFIDILDRYEVERLVLVPSLLRSLLMYIKSQKNKSTLRLLKTWVCSGETLAVSLAEEFYACFPEGEYKLCNFYGSTEVMGDVTYYVIAEVGSLRKMNKVPIGSPVDNTIIYLLDHDFRPVKTGDVGELFVSGLNLASGYVNQRDPEKFIDNPLAIDPTFSKLYRTGDFARIEKGILVYEGRTDSQVKIRGHRVDLTEVENALAALDAVEKAIVLCYRPGEMNQTLLAFVTVSQVASENEVEALVKNKLPAYMVPQVVVLENIPLLVNGKVDRQMLLKNYENGANGNGLPEADIDLEGVPTYQLDAAKVLFETVSTVLNRSARATISINSNFYDLGGNSLNSIYTITKLAEQGYHISISDFISAIDFGEILERMTQGNDGNIINPVQPPYYTTELLKKDHKDLVIEMVTSSFYHKAELERYIIDQISDADYVELVDAMYEPMLNSNLSFLAKTGSGKTVGVAINFDAWDEPEIEIHSKLSVIWEFLDFVEIPVKESQLPKGKGKVLHSCMMATHASLTTKENVVVMKYLEDETLRLAKDRGFEGIFTTNTSPLTQQLATDVYKYQTLLDFPINKFVASDNTKTFGTADDSEKALVQWKPIK